jgi:hypothetical protein
MANRKFVRIPAKDLPDLFYVPDDVNAPEDGGKNVYFARYRVVSEDSRLYSGWSPKFEIDTLIDGADIYLDPEEWQVTKTSTVLSATWNIDRLVADQKMFVSKFHVYARFNATGGTDSWQFMQEVSTTNFSTVMPVDKTDVVELAVLIPTYRGLDAAKPSSVSPVSLFPESVLFSYPDPES